MKKNELVATCLHQEIRMHNMSQGLPKQVHPRREELVKLEKTEQSMVQIKGDIKMEIQNCNHWKV